MIERMRPRPAVNADGSAADGNVPSEPKRPHDIEGQVSTSPTPHPGPNLNPNPDPNLSPTLLCNPNLLT